MNGPEEEPLPEGVPGFDDEDYDALRADLAAARVQQPMPAEVTARLEAALAAASAENAETGDVAVRRRWTPRLLAAAAAAALVVAGGVALDRHDAGTDDASSATAGVSTGDSGGVSESSAGPESPKSLDLSDLGTGRLTRAAPALRRATFAAGASRVLDRLEPGEAGSASVLSGGGRHGESAARTPQHGSEMLSENARQPVCRPEVVGAQDVIPITLDGEPAALVVFPPTAGHLLVQARSCTGDTVLTSADLPR